MRGEDENTGKMFSYVSAERRIPSDHPLRGMRQMVDGVLKELSPRFDGLYARVGRPSIAPEKLLRPSRRSVMLSPCRLRVSLLSRVLARIRGVERVADRPWREGERRDQYIVSVPTEGRLLRDCNLRQVINEARGAIRDAGGILDPWEMPP
jgi:hypothetical protein